MKHNQITKKEGRMLGAAEEYSVASRITFCDFDFVQRSAKERLMLCLLRGAFIAFAMIGMCGLFITSLELPCNIVVIFFSQILLSMLISLLFYHKWLFNIGYISFFVCFCYVAIRLMVYASSGFNAMLNHFLRLVDQKLNLDGFRQYSEAIPNSYLTITICLILISFFIVCLISSAICTYMSPTFLFVIYFPFLQICFYLDDDINYFYLALMLFAWLGVFLLKTNGEYISHILQSRDLGFRLRKQTFVHKKASLSGQMVRRLPAALCIVLASLLLWLPLTRLTPYALRNNHSAYKASMDRVIGEFAVNGLWGFWNTNIGSGGMSGGQLGDVRQVVMDFQTDLQISYVPYSLQPVYLRGYVGTSYSGRSWDAKETRRPLRQTFETIDTRNQLFNRESAILRNAFEQKEEYAAKGKMMITNVDANPNYFYTPYYEYFTEETLSLYESYGFQYAADFIVGYTSLGQSSMHEFYPYLLPNLPESPKTKTRSYDTGSPAHTDYLQIPPDIAEELQNICKQQGFHGTTEEIIEQIQDYFRAEYLYSLAPGKTPANRDFALYFLTKQKKGYCAHFATAGVLLLRSMGVPARYVEGYCFSPNDVNDIAVYEGEKASDWYEGFTHLQAEEGSEQQVLTLDVTDSSAHAWAEVYFDGFGWCPVEFTVANMERGPESAAGFWQQFGSLLSPDDSSDGGTTLLDALTGTVKNSTGILLFILVGLVLVFLSVLLILMLRSFYRRRLRADNQRLVYQYKHLVRLVHRLHKEAERSKILFHGELLSLLNEYTSLPADVLRDYIRQIEKAAYSDQALTAKELQEATMTYLQICASIKKHRGR